LWAAATIYVVTLLHPPAGMQRLVQSNRALAERREFQDIMELKSSEFCWKERLLMLGISRRQAPSLSSLLRG
jgi:hypothetical protein